ncbi:hypothetical protein J558_0346 [Acinetobacter baumannii 1106579]|nr:hypothetical protein ACINNAV82_2755 [Acinetobacter baumannii Naval-82]EXE20713.1 hypothetical protein J558_0346 [Acinetobacter baumannii 1106579]EXE77825.1 hypothetical protein J583_2144 [Acinetobacter baumannii 83444]
MVAHSLRSWRHTPFRNQANPDDPTAPSSWRHTPFRKQVRAIRKNYLSSWRHTPFRNFGVVLFCLN